MAIPKVETRSVAPDRPVREKKATEPGAPSNPSPPADRVNISPEAREETVGVATHNLGAGNSDPEVSGREAFDQTRGTVAREVRSGNADVVMLQEVGVDGANTEGRDNNEEILEEIFRQELPPGWDEADIERVSLDEHGVPVTEDGEPVYDPEAYPDTRYTASHEGETQEMTLSRARYDEDGQPVEWDEEGAITTYEARMPNDDTYTVVFGSNNEGGTYGNSVLLGPGYELQGAERRVLGNDPDDDEQRTALGVTFTTPGGEELSALSAHLTNGTDEDRGDARNDQYRALDDFADDLGGNVLIGGDFNSRAGGEYGGGFWDFLPGIDPPRHPSEGDLGWTDPSSDRDGIDRLYTQGNLEGELVEEINGVEEVHPFVRWDVTV